MKILTKLVLGAASLLAMGSAAYAQDAAAPAAPAPTWALTGTLAGQSDYRFRGISQSDRSPVPQIGLNLSGPDGTYIGSWASQINWKANGVNQNPSIEWDVFAGKHWDMGDGTDFNTELYSYLYPDYTSFGGPIATYAEAIFTLSHTFGPVALDAVYAVSPQFGLGGGTGNYVEGQSVLTIFDWLTVSGNIGHQWASNIPVDYSHADAGATLIWKSLSLDLRYLGTDLSRANCATYWMGTNKACSSGYAATLTWNIAYLP